MILNRYRLHDILVELLGSNNVYYQTPNSKEMNYPAIIYSRNNIENKYADNLVYKQDFSYEITVIDKNPDSEIVKKVSQLPMCRFNRHYTADNLNHDVFTLYF